jgi:hypothetical protein
LTWLFWLYLARRTCYEVPHYVFFSSLIIFRPSFVQIFSVTSSHIPSI